MERAQVLTREALIQRRVNSKEGLLSGSYVGKATMDGVFGGELVRNSKGVPLQSVVVANSVAYENTKGYTELWSRIEDTLKRIKNNLDRKTNISEFPDDYYSLIDMMRIDITRRRIQEQDYTSLLTSEQMNAAFSRSVRLDEFIPFAGAFKEMAATGDTVPMIQQKTGETGSVNMHVFGLGHERSLEDELYNTSIFTLEKVNAAVVRAHTGLRNDRSIGLFPALTAGTGFAASQRVGAVAEATYDLSMYMTLRHGLRRLMGLNDPQTGQQIATPKIVLAVGNNVTLWDIQRIVAGQLNRATNEVSNLESLPIDEIWLYKGDTLYVGPKKITYNGIADGYAYLFVPGPAGAPAYTLTKRGLTQEVGRGDVLQLAREKRAWYFVQTEYMEEMLGSSSATLGLGAGFGYVVEIELPTDTIET